jgi:hypothetical protein
MIEKVRVTAMAGRLLKIWGLELVRRVAALASLRKCGTAVGNQLASGR